MAVAGSMVTPPDLAPIASAAALASAAVAATRDWVNTPPGDLTPPAFADTVADNGSSAFYVLGGERRSLKGLDLYTCGMALEMDGAIVSVFREWEQKLGRVSSTEKLDSGHVHTWHHFHAEVAKKHLVPRGKVDEVVGAYLECPHLLLVAARGDHDHREKPRRRLFAQSPADLVTVHLGHQNVEQHEVGAFGRRLRESVLPR